MTDSEAGKKTALVVEDDPELRRLFKKYLEVLGLEVREVSQGRAAVKALEEKVPDLVCLDLMLPELSGFEVCEFIRRTPALRSVPVLMVSARALPADRAHAEEAGADAYLVKPFTRVEFGKRVKELLARREEQS